MLDRLGVQQKLSLLLTLPLTALVVVTIPFVVGGVDDAIGARAIVSGAQAARRVGALVQDLQQERLLGVTALTTPDTDRSAFARLAAASADAAHDLSGTDNADLRRAVADLDGLDAVRQSVQQRTAAPRQVQDEYQRRIAALVDALGLTRQPRADPVGQRQMSALDALLRANEEASRLATGLVVSATDAPAGVRTVAEARVLRQGAVDRFRQQADPDQVALFDLAAQGTNGRRIDQLAGAVGTGPGTPVLDVAAAAQTTVTLSRALQERIVHDIAVRAQGRAAGAELAAGVLIALALTL